MTDITCFATRLEIERTLRTPIDAMYKDLVCFGMHPSEIAQRAYLSSPAIYRSVKANGTWSEPELIISQFAGEPSVDGEGNIYFVHHFYTADSRMIEADIYITQRK